MGIDPVTHKARSSLALDSLDVKPLVSSTLSHMSQWDRVRMETEARLSSDLYLNKTQAALRGACTPAQTSSTSDLTFLRSWKAQVTESLRRDLTHHANNQNADQSCSATPAAGKQGPLEIQGLLQDWEDSTLHHSSNSASLDNMYNFSTTTSETSSAQLIHRGQANFFASQMQQDLPPLTMREPINLVPSSAALTCEALTSTVVLPRTMDHRSPTSTLSSPFSATPHDHASAADSPLRFLPTSSDHSCGLSSYQSCATPASSGLCSSSAAAFWVPPSFGDSSSSGRDDSPASNSPAAQPLVSSPLQSIPAELLLELQEGELPETPKVHQEITTITNEFGTSSGGSVSNLESLKDYWANMLHLVGPPAATHNQLCPPLNHWFIQRLHSIHVLHDLQIKSSSWWYSYVSTTYWSEMNRTLKLP